MRKVSKSSVLTPKYNLDIGVRMCQICGKKVHQPYALTIEEIMEEDTNKKNVCQCPGENIREVTK